MNSIISQGCSNYLKSLIEHLLAYLSQLYSRHNYPWIYRNVAHSSTQLHTAPSKKCCLTVDCAAGSVSTLQSWHRYIQPSLGHTRAALTPDYLRPPSHHYHHYRDQGARKRVKSWLLLLAWCEKCPLQPISCGAMSYPPGQTSLLGRAGRFIEKNDYLFCGSWLPYLFSHNTPPPRSLWDLLRDSFLPFIYLSLLNIEILQTHRQESTVWGLEFVSHGGNCKKLNKVLTNFFVLFKTWMAPSLDPRDEKLPQKSYIFGFAFNESYWNSK